MSAAGRDGHGGQAWPVGQASCVLAAIPRPPPHLHSTHHREGELRKHDLQAGVCREQHAWLGNDASCGSGPSPPCPEGRGVRRFYRQHLACRHKSPMTWNPAPMVRISTGQISVVMTCIAKSTGRGSVHDGRQASLLPAVAWRNGCPGPLSQAAAGSGWQQKAAEAGGLPWTGYRWRARRKPVREFVAAAAEMAVGHPSALCATADRAGTDWASAGSPRTGRAPR